MFLEGKALLKTYISQLEIYRSALVPGHETFYFIRVRGRVPERAIVAIVATNRMRQTCMRLTVLWRVAAKSDLSVSHCAFLFYTIVGRPWCPHDIVERNTDVSGWGGGKVLLKTYIFQLGILFLRCRVERDTDVWS